MAKSNKKNKRKQVTDGGMYKETYWDYAAEEALNRSGNSQQLKGTIQEIAYRDKKNLSLDNIVNGKFTKLTKSKVATSSDVITLKNGKVVERIQIKDVTSSAGLKSIGKKVANKQYRNSKLVGSEETASLYGQKYSASSKKMISTGISSKTTTRTADNAGVKVRTKDITKNNFADVAMQSKNSAFLGGAISGICESVSSFSEVRNGNKSIDKYVVDITAETAKGAAVSAAKTAGALALKEGAKAVAKKVGSESLKKVVGSNPATAVAFGFVDQAITMFDYANGKVDDSELIVKTCENVGSTGGAIGGAMVGASLGSVVPVIGTCIGGVIGGIIGSLGGSSVGGWLGGMFDS